MRPKKTNEPKRIFVNPRELSRRQRERLLSRLVMAGIGLLLLSVVSLLGVGYWREVLHKGDEAIAVVNGQPITLASFAKVRGYRSLLIDQAIYSAELQLSMFNAQAQNTPTPDPASSPTPEPTPQGTPPAEATPQPTPDLNDMVRQQYQQQIQSLELQRAQLDSQVLEDMIDGMLYRQEASRRGLSVTPEEVDAEIERQFGAPESISEEGQSPTPSAESTGTSQPGEATQPAQGAPTAVQASDQAVLGGSATAVSSESAGSTERPVTATPVPTEIAQPTETASQGDATQQPGATAPAETPQATPTPVDAQQQLRDYLAQVKLLTADEFRYWIIEPILLEQKVRDAIGAEVPATAEQVHARHILVSSEEEAKQVRERLDKGEPFDHVAQEVSQDPSNKDKGGDLGWFGKGVMDPDFEKAAFELGVGETSQPVKSSFGYHIIKVEEHAQDRPLSDDQLSQAKAKAFQDWLSKQKLEGPNAIQRLDTPDKLAWAQRYAQDVMKAAQQR